jgi:hypothetical protein
MDDPFLPVVEPPSGEVSIEANIAAELPPPPELSAEPALAPMPVVSVAGDETPMAQVEPPATEAGLASTDLGAMLAAEVAASPEPLPPEPEPAELVAPPPAFSAASSEEAPSKFAEPAAPAAKRSNIGLFVGVGLVLLVAIAVYAYMRMQEGAAPTGDSGEVAPTKAAPGGVETAAPKPSVAAAAEATATAAAEPSAEPTASAEAAPAPASDPAPPKDPASLPATMGFLLVKTSLEGEIFVQGTKSGAPGQVLEVPCGTKFVSVGVDSPAGPKSSAGKSIMVGCQTMTTIELP